METSFQEKKKRKKTSIFIVFVLLLDPLVVEALIPWKQSLDEAISRHVGYTDVDLSDADCRSGECNLGSLIADSMVAAFVPSAQPGHWTYGAIALMPVSDIRMNISKGGMSQHRAMRQEIFSNKSSKFPQISISETSWTCYLMKTIWNASSCEATTFWKCWSNLWRQHSTETDSSQPICCRCQDSESNTTSTNPLESELFPWVSCAAIA